MVKKWEDVCSDSGKSIFSILDSAGITIFLNHHRTNRRRYLLMQISCPAHRRVQRAFLLNAMISLKLIIVRVIKNTAYSIIVSNHSIGIAAILIGQKHWNHLFSNLSYLTATFLQYPQTTHLFLHSSSLRPLDKEVPDCWHMLQLCLFLLIFTRSLFCCPQGQSEFQVVLFRLVLES